MNRPRRFARATQTLALTLTLSAVLGTALAPSTGLADDEEKEKRPTDTA